jgi:predicted HTH domain antitoxin
MPLTVSDELLQTAHLSEAELLREIAVTLFQQDRLTLGQAAAFAGLLSLTCNEYSRRVKFPFITGRRIWSTT